jgi:hypothetical protein
MEPLEGDFSPTTEVDEAVWLPPDDAAEQLSYERDVEILRSLPA